MDIITYLTNNGWREYSDPAKGPQTKAFYKQLDTPTRCCCNVDKPGIQAYFTITQFESHTSCEISICGEIKDGSWIELTNWAFPINFENVDNIIIPRLLKTWEVSTNQ